MSSASGIKMGQGYVALGVDRSGLDKGLEAAKSTFQAWGKGIAALGAAIAAGGASITAPFLGGLGEFAAWGSSMRTAMRESNMGFTEARTAMNGLGISAEELPTVTARVAEFVEAARNGSREANAALAEMGVGLNDLASASHGDRLNMLADGLNRIGDSGLRMTRQRDIFRGSGLSMNIGGGSEGVRQRAARRDYLQGDSYGAEGQRVAADYARAQGELGTATAAIWQSLDPIRHADE